LIGGLWANLSEGRCRFVMVKDKRWEWIEEKLSPSLVGQD
jgi:type III restriction enzyme